MFKAVRKGGLKLICCVALVVSANIIVPTAAHATPLLYQIKNVRSGLCLDVEGVSYSDGAQLQEYYCTSGLNQKFYFVAESGGYQSIRAWHSDKCLDVPGGSTANGVVIVQWTCNHGYNQQWWSTYIGSGWSYFTARHSGKLFEGPPSAVATSRVSQYSHDPDSWYSTNQWWTLVPA